MNNVRCTRKQVDALLTFLEPINEYDREEAVAAICANLDLDSRASVRKLLEEQYFLDKWYSKTTAEIKRELSSVLLEVMQDRDFDFEWLTHEADGTFCLPVSFGEGRSRMLYEEVYRAVFDYWRDELLELGLVLIPPSKLEIPPL